jgi:hypothetical protein
VLFFPESSLLVLELCSKKPTHFRICDSDDDNSVMICSQIDYFRTKNEDFLLRICPETFLNDWSSKLQSIDGPFRVFCSNNFFSVEIISILMTTWMKSDQFFMPKNLRKISADFRSVMKLCLQIQGSLGEHSPFERFDHLPFHKLKHLNCSVYFGRVMRCHRFWVSVTFCDDIRPFLITFTCWSLSWFRSTRNDWPTLILWSFRKDWSVINWKHTTQDCSVCFDEWFCSIPLLLNRSKAYLKYDRQIQR